uniref:tRNA (guanine(37)-N1)-methyltransferase n=1 Tax=Acrobeloides nanus TaxID=290746 RepID=A0A914EC61_9BILA
MSNDCTLWPPSTVRGIKVLDRSLFTKLVKIPFAKIPTKSIGRIAGAPLMKQWTIERMNRIKPIMEADTKEEKLILFNPDTFTDEVKNSVRNSFKELLELDPEFGTKEFTLTYEDWDLKRCLDAIFDENTRISSFTQIGHIAHLNLRDEALAYKNVLAQILFDKLPKVKTVVNKLDKINSNFRFFEMELLAGEPEYITEIKEFGLTYRLDFSKVFWNSRLSNEHHRIVEKLDRDCVVFDVFAGIGPFALPAIKKLVAKVFANDLNPTSIEYLKENIKLNKIDPQRIETYNLDGAQFIREIISEKLTMYLKEDSCDSLKFHVLMNLPALAVTFLPNFKGILDGKIEMLSHKLNFFVHCYTFIKATEEKPMSWFEEQAILNVRCSLDLPNLQMAEVHHVRTVSNLKEMFCLTFELPFDYFLSSVNNSMKRQIDTENQHEVKEKVPKLDS